MTEPDAPPLDELAGMAAPLTYEYADLPLTPNILASIARELFSGRVAKRRDIAAQCLRFHVDRGGRGPAASDVLMTAKKALASMVERGDAEAAGAGGFYRFPDIGVLDTFLAAPSEQGELQDTIDDAPPELAVLESFGEGSQRVYAYYFPAYRDLADARGDARFPMKIGMSNEPSLARVADQIGTALPEMPVVALVVSTNDARRLERVVHDTLKLRRQAIDDAPGAEWFATNPQEVREIVHHANGWTEPPRSSTLAMS